jgi:hypothetical protein
LKRSIDGTQARDKVKRNVVLLSETPTGKPGRPSTALHFGQAEAVLAAAEKTHSMRTSCYRCSWARGRKS